jgi:uncharacterized RDD family membrane protein YckC
VPPPPAAYPPFVGRSGYYQTCRNCGRPLELGAHACTTCGQVAEQPIGVMLSPAGRRFGQYCLEILLVLVTVFIGWFIWSLIVWSGGQTPAQQLLGMRVLKISTGVPATWGTMFLREFVAKGLIMGLVSVIFFPAWFVLAFMLLWDNSRQEVWDKIAGTLVVNDPVQI